MLTRVGREGIEELVGHSEERETGLRASSDEGVEGQEGFGGGSDRHVVEMVGRREIVVWRGVMKPRRRSQTLSNL